ncbi:MAG TPA: hypothetical protein VFQ27_00790 [Xanthobacteraceae bacterium]|nr:hypothetical protein [Xanthobacteraceae bacterium]
MTLLREPPGGPARHAWVSPHSRTGSGPWRTFCAAVALAFAAAALTRAVLPEGLLIPITASLLLAAAAAAAFAGWIARQHAQPDHLTYWDVAGALAFIGIGLSALLEGEELVRLIETVPRKE